MTATAPANSLREPAFFVSTQGQNNWSGRFAEPNADGTDGPFATLERARDAMRAGGVDTTYVRGGTYHLTRSLDLTALDSGFTFAAFPGEQPVISGGERVTGFQDEGNGLFSAATFGPTGLDLTIGGQRQKVAQTGDWDPADPYTSGWLTAAADGTATTVRFEPGKVRAQDVESGVLIQTFNTDRLADGIVGVNRIDEVTGTIHLESRVQYAVKAGGTYRLLNNDDFIRDNGEFAWRAEDSRLVVKPDNPETFEQDGVVVPRLGTLVRLTGASRVTLTGLTFTDTLWNGNGVELSGADHNRIVGNHFINIGNGLKLAASSDNLIAGNLLEHLGASGVYLSRGSDGNRILGNRFDSIGEITKHVGAVMGNGVHDNRIAFNEISNSARYGISIKDWNADNANTGNVIEYNLIRRTGLETADTAAIETLGRSNIDTRMIIRGNRIEESVGLATRSDGSWIDRHKSFGIYLDDQTNSVTVRDNFIRDVGWAQVFIHGGDNNLVENNIGILGRESEEFIRIEWVPLAGDAGIPRNNNVIHNVISGTLPLTDYWELWSANNPRIEQNLVHNTRGYGSRDVIGLPLFLDPARGDWRLSAGSAAFELGITDLPWDRMGPEGYDADPLWQPSQGTGTPPSGANGGTGGTPSLPVSPPATTPGSSASSGLIFQAPNNVALQGAGSGQPQPKLTALETVATAAQAGGVSEPALFQALASYASRYGGASVTVHCLTASSQPGASGGSVFVRGSDADVVVLDARGLQGGSLLDLDSLGLAIILGNAQVAAGTDLHQIVGDAGAQSISAAAGADTVWGGGGNDILFGNAGVDILHGNAGHDTLFGGAGADTLLGGQSGDQLFGRNGDDSLLGALGHDQIAGNEGQDLLAGNLGNDTLLGGVGDDVLQGGQGADSLVGALGNDTLTGGEGTDLFLMSGNGGRDIVTDFNAAQGDRIGIAPGNSYSLMAEAAGLIVSLSGGGQMVLHGLHEPAAPDWFILF